MRNCIIDNLQQSVKQEKIKKNQNEAKVLLEQNIKAHRYKLVHGTDAKTNHREDVTYGTRRGIPNQNDFIFFCLLWQFIVTFNVPAVNV